MKKKILIVLAVFIITFVILLYFSPQNITLAADEKTVEEELDKQTEEQLDNLDTNALEEFFKSLTDEEKSILNADQLKDLVLKISNGEAGNIESIFDLILDKVTQGFVGFLPSLITIVAIVLLYGILSGLNSGFLSKSTNEIIFFVCYAIIVIILLNTIANYIKLTVQTVSRLQSLMSVLFPIFLTLLAALGGTTGVGLYQPLMVIATGFVIEAISKFILPCFIAALIFLVVGNLSKNVKLNKFSAFFKSIAEWSLGIIFSVFMMLVTMRGIAGRTIDGIGITATKFAIGSYVPILGGYLSDGFDLVMASCILLKNSVGVAGLMLVLVVVISPIIKLAMFSLGLKLAAAIAEPLSDNKISNLLQGVSKSMSLLLSVLCGTAFMYFILIMLVIYSCNLGVV